MNRRPYISEKFANFVIAMRENSLYDRKSLRAIHGPKADFKEIAKDCVGFANAQGGVIDLGIEDDADLPDAAQRIPEDLPTKLVNKIAGLTVNVSATTETITADNGGEFLRLFVQRNAHSLASTSDGRYYIRIGDSSKPVTGDDFFRLAGEKDSTKWENIVSQCVWQKCDRDKLSDFIVRIKDSDRVSDFIKEKETKEILDYFGLTKEDGDEMTNLGVLFIGTQSQRGSMLHSPIIQCIKYDADGEKVQKYLWDDYTMNPIEMIESVWERVPDWKETNEISDGLYRRNIIAYDERVIRELCANSLVHRSYAVAGDIFINIHPDRVEFVNPGQLPLGVTANNILHKSVKRNERMANLFYALHLMEREGSGYDKMYEVQLTFGKQVPHVVEGDDYVVAVVERRIVSQEAIKVMQTASQNIPLKQKQLICLGMIAQAGSISGSELIRQLELKDNVALRPWLRPLIDMGLVETNDGKTKSVEYRVVPQLLRDSNFKGKTTLRRIEPHRLRELILEDLKLHGPSSIKDINTRIGEEIPRRTLSRAIKDLIDTNDVLSSGYGKTLRYELSRQD